MHGEEQAGIFFGSGAAVLVLLLGEIRYQLRNFRGWAGTLTPALSRRERGRKSFALWQLSAINTARNPGRSTLTIGLVAAASFLIVAVSAFRLDTGEGGTGGFDFFATSDQPIHYDLNTPQGRQELGIIRSPRSNRAICEQLLERRFYSLRVASGEDASCLNLYQPTQPRVLGIPLALIERGGFDWSATAAGFVDKPWAALDSDVGRDDSGAAIVPAVLDMSTAIYSLHLSGVGSRFTIRDAAGRAVTIEVVGLLNNSVMQGNLLVSEANFLKMFPDTGGYKFFLIERRSGKIAGPLRGPVSGEHSSPAIGKVLEAGLAEEGFDVVDARAACAIPVGAEYIFVHVSKSRCLGIIAGDGRAGRCAVAWRAGTARRAGARCGPVATVAAA